MMKIVYMIIRYDIIRFGIIILFLRRSTVGDKLDPEFPGSKVRSWDLDFSDLV